MFLNLYLFALFRLSSATFGKQIKRVAYVWTGDADHANPDFLATISLDASSFGEIIAVTPTPSVGNEPHHIGFNEDKSVLATGGLLSLLSGQPGIFLWDLSNPLKPTFIKTVQSLKSAATDEIKPRVGGGFWITDMGSFNGSSPGALLELQPDLKTFTEWPTAPVPTINATDGFNPHGFSIDEIRGNIITVDFVEPASTLKAISSGPVLRNTVRIWDLATRTIKNTVYIPDAGGVMDVEHLKGDPLGRAIVTAVALGKLFLLNPADGSFVLAFDIGIQNIGACYIAQTNDGSFLYITLSNPNRLLILDARNPTNMKRVDKNPQPLIGPHYIALTPDEKQVVISDYFLQEGPGGFVNLNADYMFWVGDIQPNHDVIFRKDRFVNFTSVFSTGPAHPHGLAIRDV